MISQEASRSNKQKHPVFYRPQKSDLKSNNWRSVYLCLQYKFIGYFGINKPPSNRQNLCLTFGGGSYKVLLFYILIIIIIVIIIVAISIIFGIVDIISPFYPLLWSAGFFFLALLFLFHSLLFFFETKLNLVFVRY